MDDFDTMEDLETLKTNFPSQTNPLYEAVKRVFALLGLLALGISAATLFYGLCYALVNL